MDPDGGSGLEPTSGWWVGPSDGPDLSRQPPDGLQTIIDGGSDLESDYGSWYSPSDPPSASDELSASDTSEDDSPVFESSEMVSQYASEWGLVPWSAPRKISDELRDLVEAEVIEKLPASKINLPEYRAMTRGHVSRRMKELFGFKGRDIQNETIWTILIAGTGTGKSLIFKAIPLLDPLRPGIALVVMPLRNIQWEKAENVNKIAGARAVVYNGETQSQLLRYQIAAGNYTHGRYLKRASTFL
ncbi:MAG: hypothetical protein Q9207_004819 [Kuettlingeria erythrocarpa]